jgi:2,4-diaminopentanoate dehydrogenase
VEVVVPIRVIQWGAGANGQSLIRAVAAHPDLELVGCRVWTESKDGVDAGVLAGIGPLGVLATRDAQALVDLPADVVLFLPALAPDMSSTDDEALRLLRSGKDVISLSGADSMPAVRADGFGARIEAACAVGASTFHATGVNPGFIAERLAPTLTGLCAEVTSVTVSESYDCSNSTAALLFDTMGFGLSTEEWSGDSAFGQMFNRAFEQLIHNMAHTFGSELARVDWTCATVPAHRDIEVAGRTVVKGSVAGIIQTWEGIPTDPTQILITKRTQWACSDDVPGVPVSRGWDVVVRGKPNLLLHVESDPADGVEYYPENMVGAAIPAIAEVVAAEPGILLPRVFAPFRRRVR